MPFNFADVSIEYTKNKQLKKNEVKNFVEWVNQQPHLPKINDLQAILFLHACYYKEDVAKKTIDTYFTVKTMYPSLFKMRNPHKSPLKEALDVVILTPLPEKTPEGYTIMLCKLLDFNPNNLNMEALLKLFDMICMLYIHENGIIDGCVAIIDMKGAVFRHLFHVSPSTLKRFLHYVQEGIPTRLKRLHYVNIVPFMDTVLSILKPLMKKELYDILYLHKTVDDLTEYVPLECLPEDYGGSAEAVSILHEKMKKKLFENIEFFEWEDQQQVDESKRPARKSWFNWF